MRDRQRHIRGISAVVLGLSPTGLYAARELGQAGIPVAGVASERQAGCASRYLQECIVEADEDSRLELLLDRFATEGSRPILIPTSDQDVDFIISHTDRLSRHFEYQDSYRDGVAEALLTKERLYELCDAHSIAFPRYWKGLKREVRLLSGEVQYPCFIKPSRIHEIKSKLAGKKGWIVRDASEFHRVVETIPDESGILLLQEIIPGPESEITLFTAYFDRQGKVHQPFTAQKLRQYPPGFGSASLVRSVPDWESRNIAERFLKEIGYRGIAAAEFKRDARDGVLKLIEINPRPSLWFSVSTAAGKRVTLTAYHDLATTGFIGEEIDQINDVFWRYSGKDLYSYLFYSLHPNFILPPPNVSAVSRMQRLVHAVYAIEDPEPMLLEHLNFLKKLRHRLLAKLGCT